MRRERISAVYQIKNMVTGDRYVGSSVDVYKRWTSHKCPSRWKVNPNSKLYQDFQKYGVDNFMFAILAPVEPEYLKQVEQEFIEMLQPAYNQINANGVDVERMKKTKRAYQKEYNQSEKGKAYHKAYNQSEKYKAYKKVYNQSEKAKTSMKAYDNQLCEYNGETITLCALSSRFSRAGIPHATLEAKKYLIQK